MTANTDTALRGACARAINHDPGPLLDLARGASLPGLTRYFIDQGIHGLLYDALQHQPAATVDAGLLATLQRLSHREAGRSLLQEHELQRVDAALRQSGLRCVALKGTPLAYSIYPSPALRPRADIDLLFAESDIAAARECLIHLGYRCQPLVTPLEHALFLTTQFTCRRSVDGQPPRFVDAHWRISNSPLFANKLQFDELCHSAAPISSLTTTIHAPDPMHSLLIACMHRISEADRDRLIWIYDIHLLLQQSAGEQIAQAVGIAVERGLACIVLDGLTAARDAFASEVDPGILSALRAAISERTEPAARLLRAGSTLARRCAEFRALPGWRQRLRMLRASLFPPKSYLQLQGLTPGRAPWLWAYLKRIAMGIRPAPNRGRDDQ